MSLLGASLFSPELKTSHPITIVPALDVSDNNPMTVTDDLQNDALNEGVAGGPAAAIIKSGISTWKATEAYDIDWPTQNGAVSYQLFSSMSPAGHGHLIQDGITDTHFRFFPPYFSESVVYFFWVAFIDVFGNLSFITDDPASLISNAEKTAFTPNPITDDPAFYPAANELNAELARNFQYIRSSNRLDLEIGAEPAFLYLRRHAHDRPWGIPCSCVRQQRQDDSDPDYEGVGRCKLCFGTGIFGGFLPKIAIAVRYGFVPEQAILKTRKGFEINHVFNTYMLWLPVVRQGDLVVMQTDGRRYEVEKVSPNISARAVRFQQAFDLREIAKTEILYEVTDAAIQRSLDQAKLPGFMRQGYKAFS